MTEPQTKAGREFLDEWGPPTVRELVRPGILAIEAEAAGSLVALREALQLEMDEHHKDPEFWSEDALKARNVLADTTEAARAAVERIEAAERERLRREWELLYAMRASELHDVGSMADAMRALLAPEGNE